MFWQMNEVQVNCGISKMCIIRGYSPLLTITYEFTITKYIIKNSNAYAFPSLLRLHVLDHSRHTLNNEQYANWRAHHRAHQAVQWRTDSGGSSRGQACYCDDNP